MEIAASSTDISVFGPVAAGYDEHGRVLDFTWDRSKGEMLYELRGRVQERRGIYLRDPVARAKEMESPWSDPFTKIPA